MTVDFNHHLGVNLFDTTINNLEEKRMLQLIESLKPTFSKDGNQFCFLYGELPNDCVIGFGDTAHQAMSNFCKNFYMEKAVIAPTTSN